MTELFRDEGMLGNGQQTFCSRTLKAQRCQAFIAGLRLLDDGIEIVKVVGYSAMKPERVSRMAGHADREGLPFASR